MLHFLNGCIMLAMSFIFILQIHILGLGLNAICQMIIKVIVGSLLSQGRYCELIHFV